MKGKPKSTRKWNTSKLDRTALVSTIDRQLSEAQLTGGAEIISSEVTNIMRIGCNESMSKLRSLTNARRAVHWWNDTICDLRRDCIRFRRRFTRAKRRGTAETELREYKEAKKKLGHAISESKRKQWEELREDINRNPWGLGYKIVMKKLGLKNQTQMMNAAVMDHIVTTLFPTHGVREDSADLTVLPAFTTEELKAAANGLQDKKAPGPDGIPVEVIKEMVNQRPEVLLHMYNQCLREGVFPKVWKRQKLVLISKGKGDPESPSAYRPLCMLDTAGKLLERLIKPRLEEAIRAGGGLSIRQHGFRPGKYTIRALKDVVRVV